MCIRALTGDEKQLRSEPLAVEYELLCLDRWCSQDSGDADLIGVYDIEMAKSTPVLGSETFQISLISSSPGLSMTFSSSVSSNIFHNLLLRPSSCSPLRLRISVHSVTVNLKSNDWQSLQLFILQKSPWQCRKQRVIKCCCRMPSSQCSKMYCFRNNPSFRFH